MARKIVLVVFLQKVTREAEGEVNEWYQTVHERI